VGGVRVGTRSARTLLGQSHGARGACASLALEMGSRKG